ncbi:MAG: hypothetical protein PWQ96_2185, partial [Clostridia bacterium]|nr:hypothetical protein [Clostridia bacterium]
KMKVDLVTGFLGAGKTTLVLNILQELQGKEKVAVLVNEMGKIGLDGGIIREKSLQVLELTQGCICCSLKGNFIDGVNKVYQIYRPERLIIEPTGIASPGELINLLKYDLADIIELSSVTGVVDAVEFFKQQANFGNFYANQIKIPKTLLINKCDLISDEELETVSWAVQEINPHAIIIPTKYCITDVKSLLNTSWDNGDMNFKNEPFPHLDIFNWKNVVEFDEQKLLEFAQNLKSGKFGRIYRAKGFFNLSDKVIHIEWVMDMINYKNREKLNSYSVLTVLGEVIYKDKLNYALNDCSYMSS